MVFGCCEAGNGHGFRFHKVNCLKGHVNGFWLLSLVFLTIHSCGGLLEF